MSTRAVVNFAYEGKTEAKVYVHSDGYPDGKNGMLATLESFFKAVEGDTDDTRFDDPSYLAAKFVVYMAQQAARSYDFTTKQWTPKKPLDFLGVGVTLRDPGDLAYVYTIDCGVLIGDRPTVSHQKA